MQTPFKAHFDKASIALWPVTAPPFTPLYPMPYVPETEWINLVGNGVTLIYREFDAFDTYVATLEAWFSGETVIPLEIPVESLLNDLHLVYQQVGASTFPLPEQQQSGGEKAFRLEEDHHLEVYTPPVKTKLRILPNKESSRYVLTVVVPKGDWITRHPAIGENPMEALIRCRKEKPGDHRYVGPSPASPDVQAWVFLLLSIPPYSGMDLDDALNGPMVKLVGLHRDECSTTKLDSADDQRVEAARLVIREWVIRMTDGQLPTQEQIMANRPTNWERLDANHKRKHGMQIHQYLRHCRLHEAKDRLLRGQRISTVAYVLGWTEVSNFSMYFKQEFGLSPRQFVKKSRQ